MSRARVVPFCLAVIGLAYALAACSKSGLYDPARDPQRDLDAALADAQATHRQILLEVGRDTCPWTRALDRLFADDAELARVLSQGFVHVRVHRSKEHDNAAFLARFPAIPGVPHLFFLDASGALLASQDTGELETGEAHDPAKVLTVLKRWAQP